MSDDRSSTKRVNIRNRSTYSPTNPSDYVINRLATTPANICPHFSRQGPRASTGASTDPAFAGNTEEEKRQRGPFSRAR
jgi:hypothetical protein